MSQFIWIVNTNETINDVNAQVGIGVPGASGSYPGAADAWAYFRTAGNFLQDVVDGAKRANIQIETGTVQASGTITLSSSAVADTVTVNGVVLTEVTSGATNNQFVHGGTDTITATNLAAAINASTSAALSKAVKATSSGAIVTVTAIVPGQMGNMGTLAISAHGSVSGANLTGGTQNTVSSVVSAAF